MRYPRRHRPDERNVRTCRKCKTEKPLTEFHRDGERYRLDCAACRTDAVTRWCKKNKDVVNAAARKRYWEDPEKQYAYHLQKTYGLTLSRYNEVLKKQDGKCAICGVDQSKTNRRFGVDHDQVSGRIRGIICGRCNRGMGYLQDNAEICESAARYIREHGRSQKIGSDS